jgi:hypothetical protein
MDNANKNHTFGDSNISLQDITARDIKIITGKESNQEVRQKKEEVARRIAVLLTQLADISNEEIQKNSEFNADESDFCDIGWDDLLMSIEEGKCVLFIGQDIFKDVNGNSLHEEFFKSISGRKIEYDEKDGFFLPGTDKQIETKALNFYTKKFYLQNNLAYDLLYKLAQIPFALIVQISPDNTMQQIFENYNKIHEFKCYKPNEKQECCEPSIENPVIYNLLGNAASNGKYIYTHEQFYKYVNEEQAVKIPVEIEDKIKDVPNYLFIGIDFNKWYNRLLLFTLNLYENAEAYTFNSKSTDSFIQNFINKQFNIISIEQNYNDFISLLIHKCKDKGVFKPLSNTFVENTLNNFNVLKDKAYKADSLTELSDIENELDCISEKINQLR